MRQKLGAVFVALAMSTFALASCSGSEGGYSPPELPAGGEAPQYQNASGMPAEAPAAQQAPPQQELGQQLENAPPQEGAPPLEDAPPGEGAPLPGTPPPPRKKTAAAAKAAMPGRCPTQAVPGTYTVIVTQGRIDGATFTASPGSASVWERVVYTAAKPASKSKPATQKHASQPLYVYSGTYTVYDSKNNVDTVGCASLVTSQDGAVIKGTKFGGRNANNPFATKPAHGTVVASGAVTRLTIAHLSQAGGTGTFALSNKFTGTIALTSRSTVP